MTSADASIPLQRDDRLGFDPDAAIAHLRTADAKLAQLIDAAGPFDLRLQRAQSVFSALSEAIVYQQLNGRAASIIYARVSALFPRARNGPTPQHILGASDESLRGAGLSRNKTAALRDLAQRTHARLLPTLADMQHMDDEEVTARLIEVRGIGRWTAEMFLIFRLGRPDVLPADDFGVRKGFGITFKWGKLPEPAEVERRGARWKPYRTVASWYLWRAVEVTRQGSPTPLWVP